MIRHCRSSLFMVFTFAYHDQDTVSFTESLASASLALECDSGSVKKLLYTDIVYILRKNFRTVLFILEYMTEFQQQCTLINLVNSSDDESERIQGVMSTCDFADYVLLAVHESGTWVQERYLEEVQMNNMHVFAGNPKVVSAIASRPESDFY